MTRLTIGGSSNDGGKMCIGSLLVCDIRLQTQIRPTLTSSFTHVREKGANFEELSGHCCRASIMTRYSFFSDPLKKNQRWPIGTSKKGATVDCPGSRDPEQRIAPGGSSGNFHRHRSGTRWRGSPLLRNTAKTRDPSREGRLPGLTLEGKK